MRASVCVGVCVGAVDGNAAYHILQRWISDEGAGSALVKPILHPAPELEIMNLEEAAWNMPREMAGFRRPKDRYIGKRKMIHAAQPARPIS